MTLLEFERWPCLLLEWQVLRVTGWARNTLRKYVENGLLEKVQPSGAGHARYRKKQVAQLLEWPVSNLVPAGTTAWERLPWLLSAKGVQVLTGYSAKSLARIVRARGLSRVLVPGGVAKFKKGEIGKLLGL